MTYVSSYRKTSTILPVFLVELTQFSVVGICQTTAVDMNELSGKHRFKMGNFKLKLQNTLPSRCNIHNKQNFPLVSAELHIVSSCVLQRYSTDDFFKRMK